MPALLQRNLKLYFSNVPGVVMSCLGALISFFIYIGFLKQNLLNSWNNAIPHAQEMLDLWMIAGIVTIAGMTTSFQALGQLVKDRENRVCDDLYLTDISLTKQHFAYILSASFISVIMQTVTLVVTISYFKLADQISVPNDMYFELIIFMVLGAVSATMVNQLIVTWIHSSTTFSRLSAIIGTIAGFAVATYLPYGALSHHVQTLVKWLPSSYEAAGLRSLLLGKISKTNLKGNIRNQLTDYLGIHFQVNGQQLTRVDNIYMMLGMMIVLAVSISIISIIIKRKRV